MYEIIFVLIIVTIIVIAGLLVVNRFIGGIMPDFGKGFVDATKGIQESIGNVFGGLGTIPESIKYKELYLKEKEMEQKRSEQEHIQRMREAEALYEMATTKPPPPEKLGYDEEVWTELEEKAQERLSEFGHPYATGRTEETGAFMYDSKTGEYTYF